MSKSKAIKQQIELNPKGLTKRVYNRILKMNKLKGLSDIKTTSGKVINVGDNLLFGVLIEPENVSRVVSFLPEEYGTIYKYGGRISKTRYPFLKLKTPSF